MSFATRRLARLRRPIAVMAAVAIGAESLLGAAAIAQTAQQPAQKASPAKPGQRPAAPAAPAQAPAAAPGASAPAGQAAAGGPTVVQVKPGQPEWVKTCGKPDPNAAAEICVTTRDFMSDQGSPVLAVALYDQKNAPAGQPAKVVRFLMPLALMLRPGIRIAVDQGQPTAGQYSLCLPNGCFAEAPVADDFIAALKKGTTLNVSARNPSTGTDVTFAVPTEGFGKAFDGPATDPKVIEEQQKKLQSELEKKSDEMRKRLEQSAAGSTPAPAAPAAK